MAITLTPLGTFTIDKTDYSAGSARTGGAFCLVRKRYGNNAAIYNYAAFERMSFEDFQSVCANPDNATWLPYPYSNYDYTLLVLPLSAPLAASTAAGGAMAVSGGATDVSPVVNAVAAGNVILTNMLAGQSGLSRASETTQLKVLAALQGTLVVKPDGTAQPVSLPAGQQVGINNTVNVAGTFWQATQPVSGSVGITGTVAVSGPATDAQLRATPLPVVLNFPATQQVGGTVAVSNTVAVTGPATDAQLRATPLPVTLPATAATAGSQLAGNSLLSDIKALLATPGLPAGAATEATLLLVKAALLAPALATGAASAPLQTAGNQVLTSILAALGTPVLPAHASTDTLQTTGNTTLASILSALGPAATAGLQTAGNTLLQALVTSGASQLSDLDAIKASTALASTAALQTAGNASLVSIVTALGPAATAAKQDAGNTSLATLVANGATSAKQDIGNASLAAIQTNTAAGATAAGQMTQANKQDTANGLLQTLVTNGIATTAAPATPYSLVTLQGSNATTVRAGATWMLGGTVANTATAYRYLFLYNLAAAPANNAALPTTAATGLVRTIAVPPNSSVSLNLPAGRYTAFSAGLTIAAAAGSTLSTVTSAAAGLTAGIGLTAGDLIINLDFSN